MMIKGFVQTSLIDYPGRICSVIFLGGCSFKCGFCHNPEIVNCSSPDIDPEQVMSFLQSKTGWIDSVTITGGEPTIHAKLPELISKLKLMGLSIKLDTNGSNPVMLKELINRKLIDYIAMDIKAPLRLYDKATNSKVNPEVIKKSINLVRGSGIDYEFRTTIIPSLISKKDLIEICNWLKGSKKYVLQQYRPFKTLDPSFPKESYTLDDLKEFVKIAEPFFERVELRS